MKRILFSLALLVAAAILYVANLVTGAAVLAVCAVALEAWFWTRARHRRDDRGDGQP